MTLEQEFNVLCAKYGLSVPLDSVQTPVDAPLSKTPILHIEPPRTQAMLETLWGLICSVCGLLSIFGALAAVLYLLLS